MDGKVIYRKVYQEFTNDYDKDDIYEICFNNNDKYKGAFKVTNLAIYYAATIIFDIKNGEIIPQECYHQNAYDEEYEMKPITYETFKYYAEDFDDFIQQFKKEYNIG